MPCARFGKLALKESLRLNPVSVGTGRILPVDAEFGGYEVPKGTVLVTQNQVEITLLIRLITRELLIISYLM